MQKFIKDVEFEFIVFNNATFDNDSGTLASHIQSICDDLGVNSIRIEKDKELIEDLYRISREDIFNSINGLYRNSVLARAYPLCWAWKHFISKDTFPAFVLDSDMFFFNETSLSNFFDYDLCYIPQGREGLEVPYMWNGIFFANIPNLKNAHELNWFCGKYKNIPVDVGVQTIEYLVKYKDSLKIYEIIYHHVPYMMIPVIFILQIMKP